MPYFEKMIFKSVALVNDDRPDTHRLRLDDDADFDVDEVLDVFDESAIAQSQIR